MYKGRRLNAVVYEYVEANTGQGYRSIACAFGWHCHLCFSQYAVLHRESTLGKLYEGTKDTVVKGTINNKFSFTDR